uniref:CW domain-containing protein n=1 Tax=Caenorhabditis tropicalis TaxID=1561998 RepID=A0A1I7U4K2_9PELO
MMIVVSGKPLVYSGSQTNGTWENCVQLCHEVDECMLAYNNNGECQWFKYEELTSVQQTEPEDGFTVVFKVNNSTTSTCPSGTNPPTFNNQDAHGTLRYYASFSNMLEVNYTIKYSSGVWTFSSTAKFACPNDYWVYLDRPDIGWCFIPEKAPTSLTYEGAIEQCASMGAILTGAANPDEVKNIMYWTSGFLNSSYIPQSFTLRLDGKRTTDCQSTPRSSDCMSNQGYSFIDSRGATLQYYSYVTDQGARSAPGNDCLVVLMMEGAEPIVDVQSCTSATSVPARAFLCGREGWI